MMLLLKQVDVYSPTPQGRRDVLIGGGKILAVTEEMRLPDFTFVETIDCTDLKAIPGLIDGHMHFAGAGGEGGPSTRTPEMSITTILSGGITTAIGMLGTDGFTRSVESVLMQARKLQTFGITCPILTGAYQIPTPTITGDPGRDIILIREIIGAGEIAIADHRDSAPTWNELARIAKTVRVAGMLAGKPGIVCLHLGDAPDTFHLVDAAVEKGFIPYRHFIPTHCNRSRDVFERAIVYARQGGYVDITTSAYPFFPDEEVKPSEAVKSLLDRGIPSERVTLSTDAGGSLPEFDRQGNLIKMTTGSPSTLLSEIKDLVHDGFSLDKAITFVTSNPSSLYGLKDKGHIESGFCADILLLDNDLNICHLISSGNFLIRNRQILMTDQTIC
ncbi:beta-aspartyl-peptidase [bacterium]|nr:beta-aspartyl-peptidase [candidate division CSSED10-310 bacterium]